MMDLQGYDLNGLWDFTAAVTESGDRRTTDLGIHGSLVRLAADRVRWIGGRQAALAPHGKGQGWGPIGDPDNRVFVGDILVGLSTKPAEAHADALGCLLDEFAGDAREAVVAVPDVAAFDEAARERLLSMLDRSSKVRSTLLWRSIAAILGWLDEPGLGGGAAAREDMRVAVLSLMGDGVHVADAKLVRGEGAHSDIWVPERYRTGAEACESFAGERGVRRIAERLAGELGLDLETVLRCTNAPWRAGVGAGPLFELIRRRDGGWRPVPGVADGWTMPRLEDVPQAFRERLRGADAILVEGPMVENGAWREAIVEGLSLLDGPRLYQMPRDSVARGCLAAAQRSRLGKPVYYDFLPQLQINALVGDEPKFVELIPRNQRLRGGAVYRHEAPGIFAISKGARRLTFYLFKEGFDRGRKAEVDLPEEASEGHRIRVTVEQSPGQGFAQVRIGSDSFEALRRRPVQLNWARMEVVDETREEILRILKGETGLRYPDAVTTPGHAIHWHPDHPQGSLSLLDLLKAYCCLPLIRAGKVDAKVQQALHTIRERFSRPANPSFVARSMRIPCGDRGNFRALNSDGTLPSATDFFPVPDIAGVTLDAALHKAANELAQLLGLADGRRDRRLIGDLVGFATWCFWKCPDSIADVLADRYEERTGVQIQHILLREGMGRVVHRREQLERYFAVIDSRLGVPGGLTLAEFSALGRVLGGCEHASGLMPTLTADRILRETLSQLASENNEDIGRAYKRKFKFALLMLAALLRCRRNRPAFLDPDSSRDASSLLQLLARARERMEQFRDTSRRRANTSQGRARQKHAATARRLDSNLEIVKELVDLINKKGRDPNIIRRIEEMEEEE